MAIEVQIIPFAIRHCMVHDILLQVAEDLAQFPDLTQYWVEPKLLDSKTQQRLDDHFQLAPPLSVWFALPQPCTMQLSFISNDAVGSGEPDEEYEHLSDLAGNLPKHTAREIADGWKRSGYFMTLTTTGGREVYERQLLILLATALARATSGWIIPIDDVFSIPIGCYPPDSFVSARLR